MKYNPLAYIRSEKDILKLVNALIMNTQGEGEKSGEDFWVKAERLYYCALIGYIWYEAPEEEKNFIMLLDLINASEAREDDENYQSPVDILFADLEKREPEHFAVNQYKKFKMAAGKTLKSILISCGARLAPFDIKELRDLMEYDELELDTLGDEKTALFVILSDTDSTFNFVAALMYSQLFNLLCDKADDFYGGRLPVHVRLILDEFANIGQIPNFDKLIATIRSREISASIILQSQSQLKTIYKDAADGKLKIVKTMEGDGSVAGWQFKVTDSEGSEIEGSPFTSDDNGEIEISHILPGEYTIEELIPDGSLYYCKSENPQTVTITQGETAEVTFTNALRSGKITLNKVDTQGKPLAGATFLLEWSEEGSLWWPVEYSEAVEKGCCTNTDIANGCLTSGKDGIIEWDGLYPTLYYRVTEVKAPDGYNLLEGTAYEGQLPIEDLTVSFTVVNARTFTLPETGAGSGMILRIVSLLAAIGCLGAGVIAYRRKRW